MMSSMTPVTRFVTAVANSDEPHKVIIQLQTFKSFWPFLSHHCYDFTAHLLYDSASPL